MKKQKLWKHKKYSIQSDDATAQISQIENMLNKDIDVLVIIPFNSDIVKRDR